MALRHPVASAVSSLLRSRDLVRCSGTSLASVFGELRVEDRTPNSSFHELLQTRQLSNRPYDNRRSNSNEKLRTHAVSILHGNYDDYDSGGEEEAFPDGNEEEQWELANYEADDEDEASNLYDEDTRDDLQRQEEVLEAHRAEQEEKARRERNSKPPVRVQELDHRGRAYGRGGRKTATARVWIQPGEGIITVNKREFLDFFPRESDREMIISPFIATKTCGMFDVVVTVEGGGVTGKAGAIRHGVARALEKYDPEYRPAMKRLGFMTRDARKVERKKVGLKKARKAPQWVRR